LTLRNRLLPLPVTPPQLQLPAATPEARTFNTVLGACSRAAQLGAARAVYQRMIDDGVDPTGTTYTLLISAYGKAGLVSLHLLDLMPAWSVAVPRPP
jgi:pentatricopeptide repeat protein